MVDTMVNIILKNVDEKLIDSMPRFIYWSKRKNKMRLHFWSKTKKQIETLFFFLVKSEETKWECHIVEPI